MLVLPNFPLWNLTRCLKIFFMLYVIRMTEEVTRNKPSIIRRLTVNRQPLSHPEDDLDSRVLIAYILKYLLTAHPYQSKFKQKVISYVEKVLGFKRNLFTVIIFKRLKTNTTM